MPVPLNRQNVYEEDKEFYPNSAPRYSEYKISNTKKRKFRELVFFLKVAFFCLTTVALTFVFLSVNLQPLIAFPIAFICGLVVINLVPYLIKLFNT
ncbi:DUF3270 domain-containing protein [Streptococcus sp. CSL10205-OR2]|uniref:DUF3270 domain-containing protein n=1 Tax=Streptococcus sp. CSL10205-OR2 TaxID=2980558 RepID=UPI0021DAFCB9|nr:DUF3270 domain-containing protein [Streptococcus sp. CSL10205-OR2]MCU9532921.1 DUF3270 domain-containing protein [Streptococcus sp. CSL10205-OR2]